MRLAAEAVFCEVERCAEKKLADLRVVANEWRHTNGSTGIEMADTQKQWRTVSWAKHTHRKPEWLKVV